MQPFFRAPPFPGAKAPALARPGHGERLDDATLDRLMARTAQLKVGGSFWDADRDPWRSGADGETAEDRLAAAIAAGDRDAFHRAVVDPFAYFHPFTGQASSLAATIELCGFWRALIVNNRRITAAVGFARWKRPTVAPLLWSGQPVRFARLADDLGSDGRVAVWKSRTPKAALARLEAAGTTFLEVEDGFIRSAGLGADCVPPLSIVVDETGIYFDPRQTSDLERILQAGEFDDAILERARRLREVIVASGISKYATAAQPAQRRRGPKRQILVPGQVEDDRSVLSGGGNVRTNLELLRRVRERAPDAHILYKPHPDVEAGHRKGAISDEVVLTLADEVVRDLAVSGLLAAVDEVHVNTSLAGFEALLREKPVTTYGVPFFAGWGLTTDLGQVPERRTAKLTLDELVAGALLLYPRYLDPTTGLPCPPEILIHRLSEGGNASGNGALVTLRRLQGQLKRVALALRA
ncbi:beta-3-deoxy-D-manno-oct-2-ulosonic acid transferase [Sphingomonas sabuli]|uniref:Beta-3-deoxy-D-manno-oct-2-ulosonic acid transferase n=1 Tax=Sphingomonas sabuli TaxID=2764186 RepID=A0A7G9L5B2_9SPHN|nr:beta-3-deoxy-D-manno-oct-2-ulosonic acid transferase [Sphingomonas sabuli]QNM83811.1 beta-3-deoxy-D-manno-oct-2-ulosonic acid transferase [Sphingomonas sabuli]